MSERAEGSKTLRSMRQVRAALFPNAARKEERLEDGGLLGWGDELEQEIESIVRRALSAAVAERPRGTDRCG